MCGEGDDRGTHSQACRKTGETMNTVQPHPVLDFWHLMSALSLMFVFGPRVLAEMKDVRVNCALKQSITPSLGGLCASERG